MQPEGLEHVPPVFRVAGVERADPLLQRREHLLRGPFAELAAGVVPGPVLVRLEQIEQLGHRRAGDPGPVDQRTTRVGDPPDPAVRVVAVRVADRVLHVANQRVEPVDHIQGPIGPELEGHRAEIRVGRAEQRLDGRPAEARAVLLDAVAEDALEADVVIEQVIPLRLVGEVAAVDQLAAAGGPPLHREELLHPAVLVGIHHLPGERRAEIVGPAGGIRDEVLPPGVDVMAPGVGEPVRDEHVELPGLRLPSEDPGLVAPSRSVGRLDLRVVERPLLPVERTAGVPGVGVHRVVAIRGVESVHDQLADVRAVVAVVVLEEHQVGHLRDVRAAVAQLDPDGEMQPVGEDLALVGLAVVVVVLEDQDLVIRLPPRQVHRVRRHRGDPHPALGVEGHRHGVFQVGELDLRGEQLDLVALRQR